MADGYLGKCKDCTKKDAKERYDSEEGNKKVKQYEKERQQTEHRRQKKLEYQRVRRKKYPEKNKARDLLSKAVANGKIIKPNQCSTLDCNCTKQIEAHHHDYSKPLDVIWLCFYCHRKLAHGQNPDPIE